MKIADFFAAESPLLGQGWPSTTSTDGSDAGEFPSILEMLMPAPDAEPLHLDAQKGDAPNTMAPPATAVPSDALAVMIVPERLPAMDSAPLPAATVSPSAAANVPVFAAKSSAGRPADRPSFAEREAAVATTPAAIPSNAPTFAPATNTTNAAAPQASANPSAAHGAMPEPELGAGNVPSNTHARPQDIAEVRSNPTPATMAAASLAPLKTAPTRVAPTGTPQVATTPAVEASVVQSHAAATATSDTAVDSTPRESRRTEARAASSPHDAPKTPNTMAGAEAAGQVADDAATSPGRETLAPSTPANTSASPAAHAAETTAAASRAEPTTASRAPGTHSRTNTSASALTPEADSILAQIKARYRSGSSRLDLRLDPPELGRVEIRIRLDGARVIGEVRAESEAVARALESDLGRLRAALGDGGSAVDQWTFKGRADGQDQRNFAFDRKDGGSAQNEQRDHARAPRDGRDPDHHFTDLAHGEARLNVMA